MAEGPDPRDKPLEELEREITCAVCHGVYQQAKLLPCNHYYCSTCIEKMAAASRGRPLHCPECRKETSLPPGGVAALEPAFFVERMKDVYGKMAKAEGKMEAFCE
ncbi:RING finger protein nhl-1, partial [Geodia barretti]